MSTPMRTSLKSPKHGTLCEKIRKTIERLELNDPEAANYLGVSVYTARSWIKGERTPSASVSRLLEILNTLETMHPEVHKLFLRKS